MMSKPLTYVVEPDLSGHNSNFNPLQAQPLQQSSHAATQARNSDNPTVRNLTLKLATVGAYHPQKTAVTS